VQIIRGDSNAQVEGNAAPQRAGNRQGLLGEGAGVKADNEGWAVQLFFVVRHVVKKVINLALLATFNRDDTLRMRGVGLLAGLDRKNSREK
jgi:hypothetical protein